MKLIRNKFLSITIVMIIPCLIMSSVLLTSCSEDGDGMSLESPSGPAIVRYIRLADPMKADSLIVAANLGTGIVLMGENLGGTREIWFNDRRAPEIAPTWVTNNTVFVSVPSLAPDVITDKMYVVDANLDTLVYPFIVSIPPPDLYSVRNEWPQEGENLIINGDFFFEPLTVVFSGGQEGEVISVGQTSVEVSVPEGAVEGPVTLATNFGETESTFHIWDSRNIVLDFDTKVANGWRIGLSEDTDNPVAGKYLVVRGDIAANQRDEGPGAPAESPLAMEYWGGNDADRSENFYPLYPNSYKDYVLKFEAKVNKWYGGYLNLCLSTPTHAGNNQEIWSNDLNARAIWGPWADAGEEFSTGGKWITVVVPMTEFQYHMGAPGGVVTYTPGQPFIETAAGSFSTWLLGSPENSGNEIEFYIDNIRFVEP